MFFDDPLLLAMAVAFGAWLGWAMAGKPAERTPTVTSLVVGLVAGVTTWIVSGADPDTISGQAAISLTIGPAVGLLVYYLRFRRGGAPQ